MINDKDILKYLSIIEKSKTNEGINSVKNTRRKHIVISGTGRCGTTFLVELLTYIGFDTGFNANEIKSKKNKIARAGLEQDIRRVNSPYIIKSPWFCDYAEEILSRDDIVIEHLFIPVRDLYAAAESRRYVVENSVSQLQAIKPSEVAGGLWHTNLRDKGKQEEILLKKIYKLIFDVSNTSVPVTFMRYPRIVKDCPYLFKKLKPILEKITYDAFYVVFEKIVNPDLVHSFGKNDC